MKFPLATRMSAPAMGEFGSPIDRSASISTRSRPLASLAHASAKSSVTRTPLWKRLRRRRSFSFSSICGRAPCTSTSLHAQRGEQIQILREIDEAAVGHDLAAERDDESPARERRGYRARPTGTSR